MAVLNKFTYGFTEKLIICCHRLNTWVNTHIQRFKNKSLSVDTSTSLVYTSDFTTQLPKTEYDSTIPFSINASHFKAGSTDIACSWPSANLHSRYQQIYPFIVRR